MMTAAVICQIVIALGIINVWLIRQGQPTPWRPDGARNMVEEFHQYGLPDWMRKLVGAAKLTLAALLIIGIWSPPLAKGASIAMALLMAGAIGAHLQVRDPLKKSLPAFCMLLLSLFVAFQTGL